MTSTLEKTYQLNLFEFSEILLWVETKQFSQLKKFDDVHSSLAAFQSRNE